MDQRSGTQHKQVVVEELMLAHASRASEIKAPTTGTEDDAYDSA